MPTREIELSIDGMSCAACAARIEKKLNQFRVRAAAPRPRAASLPPGQTA